MCGICGFFSKSGFFSEENLRNAAISLSHRGPDAEGYFLDDTTGLGHKRLSILDLSASANQPMHSRNGQYVICYNGEVYNFREIAKQLSLALKTSSDTEVILEAFAKRGKDFIHLLNGMFSIAIYDRLNKELFIFRDRMGIKPLYYYWDGKNFAFASELKALRQIEGIKNESKINNSAIYHYLHLGYIPEPHTIYSNTFKFPSGHYAHISGSEMKINSWWEPEQQIIPETIHDLQTAKKEFTRLVKSSVHYRLISDVPYGTFLSGGVDSSLVTALAQQQTGKIKTFSIGFKESKYNEAEHARAIAGYLQTDHHEFIVSYNEAFELFNDIITTYDEPFADSSAIPSMILSKHARKSVKMVLSGDGGDELFFGYGAYRWAKRMNHPALALLRKPISAVLSTMKNREKRAAHIFNYASKKRIKSHIFSQEQYLFSEKELNSLLQPDFYMPLSLHEDYSSLSRKLNPKEAQALFDIKHYLKDDLLVKVDRASMKYGLEVRVPLLDYHIVEFALNLSPELKFKKGVDKYLLKETLYDFVPKNFFTRKKWGFALPMQEWLRKELRYLIEDYLNENVINNYGITKYSIVERLKNKFLNGEYYLYNRLWALIVLHSFLKRTS